MYRHILLSFSIFTSVPLHAGTKQHSFTREEAVAFALAHNRELNAAAYIVDAAEGRRMQAGRLPNPEVSVDYSDDFAFNNEGESVLGLGLSQSFPLSGRLKHAKTVSGIEIEMARAELEEARRVLSYKVSAALNETLALQKQIALRRQLIALNRKFVGFIQSRVKAGEVSVLDQNQAEIELKMIDQEISRLSTALISEKGELLTLLGLEADSKVTAKGSLEDLSKKGDFRGFSSDVLERRPDYKLASLGVESAEARVLLAKSEKWSDVTIGLMFENEKSVDDPEGLGTDRFFGIGVSVPLPIWNRNKGAVREGLALKRQAEGRLSALELEIRNEAEAIKSRVIKLHETVSDYRKDVLSLAETSLETTHKAYTAGQVDLMSVLKAQEQRLELESAFIDALSDYAKAESALIYVRAESVNLNNNLE